MQQQTEKPIWDIALRLFHWGLVISFTTSYLTGDDENWVHPYSGYVIIGLLCFRLLWGFIGSKHARFSDFIYAPSQILAYAKAMLNGKVPHTGGHNPLGGLMVFALLFSLSFTTLSGLKVYGLEGHGPLAAQNEFTLISNAHASTPNANEYDHHEHDEEEELWDEVHEFFGNFTLFLIVLHILGVIVSSRIEKQNLVKAMITGHKQHNDQPL